MYRRRRSPDGTTWTIVPTPNPAAVGSYLSSVSCTSATSCTAVGHYQNQYNMDVTLVERYNGLPHNVPPTRQQSCNRPGIERPRLRRLCRRPDKLFAFLAALQSCAGWYAGKSLALDNAVFDDVTTIDNRVPGKSR